MNRFLILVVLALTGCGFDLQEVLPAMPPVDSPEAVLHRSCDIDGILVTSDRALNCEVLATHTFRIVKRLMTTVWPEPMRAGYAYAPDHPLLTEEQFGTAFQGLRIHVHDSERVTCPQITDFNEPAVGCYVSAFPLPGEEIVNLTSNLEALPHELFHHWERHRGVGLLELKSSHKNWDVNGFNATSDAWDHFFAGKIYDPT